VEKRNYKLDHKLRVKTDDLIATVHEYNVDLKSNHIYLFGEEFYNYSTGQDHMMEPGVEYAMANKFIRNLNMCMRANPNKSVVIHMKTSGGYWEEGMAIYDAIKSCPTKVTILNYTHARSMSSLIFQAGNKRVMMPNSYFMFHDGTLGFEGTVKQANSLVKFEANASRKMLDIYSKAMVEQGEFKGKTLKSIKAWLRNQMDKKEDVYLSATEAVRYGLADEIFDYNWEGLTNYTNAQSDR
jgi:ATP-dependent Clp endopeptidase proteolytic subunit ClpP